LPFFFILVFTCGMKRQRRKKRWVKLSDIPKEPPPLSEELKTKATYIAMAVRNAMEDFHSEHLSDEQMKELNPIIRNAIATALYAVEHAEDNPLAMAYVLHQFRLIPNYWEPPELSGKFSLDEFLDDLRRSYRHFGENLSEAEFEERAERILNMSVDAEWKF
jgi:hypothetical protein